MIRLMPRSSHSYQLIITEARSHSDVRGAEIQHIGELKQSLPCGSQRYMYTIHVPNGVRVLLPGLKSIGTRGADLVEEGEEEPASRVSATFFYPPAERRVIDILIPYRSSSLSNNNGVLV